MARRVILEKIQRSRKMKKNRKRKKPAPSYTSPIRSTKGCLCDDNTYHPDCCDGTIFAQGVGKTES